MFWKYFWIGVCCRPAKHYSKRLWNEIKIYRNVKASSKLHCVKSVQIPSFFLFRIFPHSDWSMSPYSVRMRENTEQKKLHILTNERHFLIIYDVKKMLFFVFWLCLKMLYTNLLCCNNLWGKFFVVSRKYKKLAIFDILMMTITLGVHMKIRQMTPFFLSTFRTLSVGTFYFCISRPSKFGSMDFSSLCIIFWSVKHTHSKYDTLKLASIDIFFLHKIC